MRACDIVRTDSLFPLMFVGKIVEHLIPRDFAFCQLRVAFKDYSPKILEPSLSLKVDTVLQRSQARTMQGE